MLFLDILGVIQVRGAISLMDTSLDELSFFIYLLFDTLLTKLKLMIGHR